MNDMNDLHNLNYNKVVLKNISKFYWEGEKRLDILKEIQAEFPPGKFIALIGKSGSGKSTLLNLISGVDTPSEGEIEVGSSCLTRLTEKERTLFRRNHIGIIFQFFNLIPTLTVLENVTLCQELSGYNSAQDKKEALQILEQVGLGEKAQSFPDRLSGGEQQRVAIARALAHNPSLIIADEPTGNLDVETGKVVLDLLIKLVRESGKTLIMATHSLEVLSLADQAYTIKNSQLALANKNFSGSLLGKDED